MCGARESVEFRYSRPEHQGGCCQTSVEPSKTLNPVGYQPRETLHTEGCTSSFSPSDFKAAKRHLQVPRRPRAGCHGSFPLDETDWSCLWNFFIDRWNGSAAGQENTARLSGLHLPNGGCRGRLCVA